MSSSTPFHLSASDEGVGRELADVVAGDHLQLGGRLHGGDELVAIQEPGRDQVLHEEDRADDGIGRELQLLDGLLDAELVVEVRNARLFVGGPDRAVDEVLDALVAGHAGQSLALLFFLFDARFPGVLDREHAPGAGQRALERGLILQVALNHFGAQLGRSLGGVAVRFARHGAQLEPAPLGEMSDGGTALLSGCSGHEDRFFVGHRWSPLSAATYSRRGSGSLARP